MPVVVFCVFRKMKKRINGKHMIKKMVSAKGPSIARLLPIKLCLAVGLLVMAPFAQTVNMSLGKTATSSSNENTTNIPSQAVDGNTTTTRWSSLASDPQWLRIDLGTSITITRVALRWEAASAKNYTIDVSADGTNWTTAATKTNMAAGARPDDFTLTGTGRYIRMNGTARTSTFGYSLYEFEIYGTLPGISSQPQGQTVSAGTSANFSVTASGPGPYTYQWKRAGVNVGTNAATYATPATTAADNGVIYTVVVSNSAGSVTSASATLTVNSVPVITSASPVNSVVGTAFSYTITATGNPAPTFTTSTLPPGLTFTSPVISGNPQPSPTVTVTLTATNSLGSATKTLVINQAPVISSATTAQATVGNPFTYTITSTGSTPFTFGTTGTVPAWLSLNAGTGVLSGTPPAIGTPSFGLTATNLAGSAPGKTLAITITAAPIPASITNQPTGAAVLVGQAVTLIVVAGGSPTPTFQWQREYADIPGATSATYSIPSVTLAQNGSYRVKVTNPTSAPDLYSIPVTVNVRLSNASIDYGPSTSGTYAAQNLAVTTGSLDASATTGLNITTASGSNHAGSLVGLKVDSKAGVSNSGEVIGLDVASGSGSNLSGRVTGLRIMASSDAFNPNATPELTGLNVSVDSHGSGPANAAVFAGGDVRVINSALKVEPPDATAAINESTEITHGEMKAIQENTYSSKHIEAKMNTNGFGFKVASTVAPGAVISETNIHEGGIETTGSITANAITATTVVTTPKWKVGHVPDYVFEKGYRLQSLEDVDKYVKKNKHLPEVPSEKEMTAQGLDLTEMNLKLLKKVEELTLRLIDMDREIKGQRKALEAEMKRSRMDAGNPSPQLSTTGVSR